MLEEGEGEEGGCFSPLHVLHFMALTDPSRWRGKVYMGANSRFEATPVPCWGLYEARCLGVILACPCPRKIQIQGICPHLICYLARPGLFYFCNIGSILIAMNIWRPHKFHWKFLNPQNCSITTLTFLYFLIPSLVFWVQCSISKNPISSSCV